MGLQVHGLATMSHGSEARMGLSLRPRRKHVRRAVEADYIPELGASLVVAANNELRGTSGR